jgi:hypothetical protein
LGRLVASEVADGFDPGPVCLAVAIWSNAKFLEVDEAWTEEGVELHLGRRGGGSGALLHLAISAQ